LPIRVADVVAAAGCKRRSLEMRFRAAFGRSIVAEIQRARIERARRLLAESDLSVERIAAASGFSSSGYLIRLFKREIGLAPGAFRSRVRG
jgi:LacI family transcriptional regulator